MVWILYTHTYLIPIKETFAFATDFMYAVENLLFQFVLNGWVLVDTFFLVGAMLTTYNFLLHMNRSNGKLNLINIILSRFFRLSPSVWFTVLLAFLIPSLANGPLWHEYFDYQMSKCYYSWWATIFFFNNWLHENDMCLLHTWYLSSDFQLFLFAIAFLILLYK
jgi:peptidoglycan/LPS O-acetylase OafA/YrhL